MILCLGSAAIVLWVTGDNRAVLITFITGVCFILLVLLLGFTTNSTTTTTYQITEEWGGIKFDHPVKIILTEVKYPLTLIRDTKTFLVETRPKEIIDGKIQKEPINKDRVTE
jgi:hypothetical protein